MDILENYVINQFLWILQHSKTIPSKTHLSRLLNLEAEIKGENIVFSNSKTKRSG